MFHSTKTKKSPSPVKPVRKPPSPEKVVPAPEPTKPSVSTDTTSPKVQEKEQEKIAEPLPEMESDECIIPRTTLLQSRPGKGGACFTLPPDEYAKKMLAILFLYTSSKNVWLDQANKTRIEG